MAPVSPSFPLSPQVSSSPPPGSFPYPPLPDGVHEQHGCHAGTYQHRQGIDHPYDSDPEPNDIFYIVENCDKLKEIKYTYRDDPKDIDGINEEERRLCYVLPRYVGREEYSNIYVDHTENFGENGFINKILDADVEYIKKLIFNKESYITIGGDEYRGYNIKTIGFEYDYKDGDHRMNEKGELPPKEWLDERGCIKDEYWDRYWDEYTLETGEFWDKLREYEKKNDVFLKGN